MSDPDYWMLAAGVTFFSCAVLVVALRIYVAHCRVMERVAREGRNRSYLRSLASMAWELSAYNRGIEDQPRREKLNSGLDTSEIEALPTFIFNPIFQRESPKLDSKENTECCVCLEEFKDGDKGRILPSCGHRFHADCVDMWFFTHTTCPLCRKKVGSSLASKLLAKSPDDTANGNGSQLCDRMRASSSGTSGEMPSSESYFDLEFAENSGDPQSSETGTRRRLQEGERCTVQSSTTDHNNSLDGIADDNTIHQV